MGYKMVSYPLQERTGGRVWTTSHFIPMTAGFRLGTLCVYGMQSDNDHSDYSAPERTYQFVAYADGDTVDPDYTKDNLLGFAEIDCESEAKQRVHVFWRKEMG